MKRLSIPLAATCLASVVAAQANNFVVPSKVNTYQPGSVWYDAAPQSYPLWGSTGTTTFSAAQYLYDATDIPIGSGLLQALSFRAPHNYNLAADTFSTTVIVSASPTAVTSPSTAMAANHGPAPVTVFTGSLNVGASPNGTWPSAWQAPLPFAAPVPWSNATAQSLVVEFQTTGSGTGRSWSLEGLRAEYGFSNTEHYQGTCHNTAGNASNSWGWNPQNLVPGGVFDLYLYNYPQNPSLATNALFIGLSGLGSPIGPWVTPFPLANLGLPAPPNCNWSIDILGGAGYPMSYVTSGTSAYLRLTGLPLPNTPTLAGAQFYTQNLAVDFDVTTGQPLLFPSIAIKWTIGTGNTIPCSAVRGLSSTAVPTTGSVQQSEAAVFQLWY